LLKRSPHRSCLCRTALNKLFIAIYFSSLVAKNAALTDQCGILGG
jgi:hypothetical protein